MRSSYLAAVALESAAETIGKAEKIAEAMVHGGIDLVGALRAMRRKMQAAAADLCGFEVICKDCQDQEGKRAN